MQQFHATVSVEHRLFNKHITQLQRANYELVTNNITTSHQSTVEPS